MIIWQHAPQTECGARGDQEDGALGRSIRMAQMCFIPASTVAAVASF